MTLDEAVARVQALRDAARAVNPDILVPLPRRPDRRARRRARTSSTNTTGVVGFFGASSMERLPTEIAMTENMKRFKSIPISEESSMSGSGSSRRTTSSSTRFDWGRAGWISRPS